MGWKRRRQDQIRIGWRPYPRCAATTKVAFPNQQAAEERVAELPVEGWAVYACPFCGCWHASSRGTGGQRRPENTVST